MNTTQQRPSLEALEQELERQNAELETAWESLAGIGNAPIAVSPTFYEEFETATEVQQATVHALHHLLGATRA